MTTDRGFRTTTRLGWITAVWLFGLMILGSVVRTTGSGLSCPDWPLCGGRLIPPFEFHVMLEWTHRLVALIATVLVVGLMGWIATHRAVRARLGGLAALALLLLAVQVLLGALTVWRLLSPSIVGGHLLVALLLFGTVLAIALAAGSGAAAVEPAPTRPAARAPGSLAVPIATVAAYGQCLLGAAVSTNGAGTACRGWPTCNGLWFPPLDGGVGLQMLHRWGAYLLVAIVLVAALRARRAPDPVVRRAGTLALALVLVQAALGIGNVLMGVPPWMSALHLAAAVALVGTLLVGSLRPASAPVGVLRPATLGAR